MDSEMLADMLETIEEQDSDVDGVVVFVSHLSDNDFYNLQRLLEDFIIPAAKSSGSLPANPDGVAWLESRIEALANP